MSDENPNEADYQHGTELVSQAFDRFLRRHLVHLQFVSENPPRVVLRLGDHVISFLVDEKMSSVEAVEFAKKETKTKNLLLQVHDVSTAT